MNTKKNKEQVCDCSGKCCHGGRSGQGSSGCAVYGLGIIGALVYFWPLAVGFSGHLLALGKAIVWPALLVYQILSFLAL